MSTATAASLTVAIGGVLVGLVIYLTFRAVANHIDRKDRRAYLQANWDDDMGQWADNDGHDVGPDRRRLLEDADAHLTRYAALDDDLTGAFGPGAPVPDLTTHPDFAAGCDRLWQAIREEQQNGDQL